MKDEYFYPLYEQFDKDIFNSLKMAVKEGYSFSGDQKNKEKFFKDLILLQLVKDYRKHLKILVKYFGRDTELAKINAAALKVNFTFDKSWAVFKAEKELITMAKEFEKQALTFEGSNKKFDEFVLRYLISIWLADWTGPLYAILKKIKNDNYTIDLRELNKILNLWDFTGIFNSENRNI